MCIIFTPRPGTFNLGLQDTLTSQLSCYTEAGIPYPINFVDATVCDKECHRPALWVYDGTVERPLNNHLLGRMTTMAWQISGSGKESTRRHPFSPLTVKKVLIIRKSTPRRKYKKSLIVETI